jgi:cytoskeletal protein CcmA (bactofilin family)
MFNKGNESNRKGAAPASNPIGMSKNMTRNSTPSILSADLAITGSIKTQGEVQLDGSVEGDIRAKSLTIGEKAVVKGEIQAEQITVRGKVTGKIRGRQIQLTATAHVEGDIVHSTLSMENGAFFEGQCKHDNDPLGARSAQQGQAPQSAPPPAGQPKPAAANTMRPAPNGAPKKS